MELNRSLRTFDLVVLLLILNAKNIKSLKLTSMVVPEIADPREELQLDCHFDMGAEILYAVKWYKDDQEFFRFMPHSKPHNVTFPVKGVKMATNATVCNERRCKVLLTGLTRKHSSGAYRCEVSSEAPAFRLASGTSNITIAALAREGPKMTRVGDAYGLGDPLTAACTSGPADPVPQFTWYINNRRIGPEYLGDISTTPPDEYGLSERTSILQLPKIERNHLTGSVMYLKCEASIPGINLPPQSASQTIILRTQEAVTGGTKTPPAEIFNPPVSISSALQVNNEKLHSPGPNSSTRPCESRLIATLTSLVVLAHLQRLP